MGQNDIKYLVSMKKNVTTAQMIALIVFFADFFVHTTNQLE